MTDNTPTTSRTEYDVALSFAGEQREYVNRVALALRSIGIRVFYDGFEEENLWGKNLYDYLHQIYSQSAEYTVVFVSREYASKLWTSHERKSAQERAFQESREYILPARFDDTSIPGIGEATGYIDCTKRTPEQLAEIIAKKLGRAISHAPLPTKSAGLTFKDIAFSHETLIGLLIHAGTRGWCIASNKPTPPSAEKISSLVTVIPTESEAFRKRQAEALSLLRNAKNDLDKLSDSIGCPIRILSPLALAESTYERFVKSDRRYILKAKEPVQPFVAPVPEEPDSHLALIGIEGDKFFAYAAPADYVRDAFGIELYRKEKHQSTLFLRESTFLRNAKFLAVDATNSRFLAFAEIDKELQLTPSAESRANVIESIQTTISAERQPVQLRAGTHVVVTEEQIARRESKAKIDCSLCLDTREMVVSHNLRLYRVPCPECNHAQNRSWSAFAEVLKKPRQ